MPTRTSAVVSWLATVLTTAIVASVAGFAGGYYAAHPQAFDRLLRRADGPAVGSGYGSVFGPHVLEDEARRMAAVDGAVPAVVSIIVSKNLPTYERYLYSPFGQGSFGFQVPGYRQNGTELRQVGAGSGFVVSSDGYIVTNKHVVSDEQAEYTAVLSDGRKLPAKVLARDPSNDIAVLKVEASGLAALRFAPEDYTPRPGQSVLAIGYALGQFGSSVSAGIVSGIGRSIEAGDEFGLSEQLFDVIQTDAAINPGNSGGPLLDREGYVIGMNVARADAENLGFAIPSGDVRVVFEAVRDTGRVVRPFVGVRYRMITPDLKASAKLPVDSGALVLAGADAGDAAVTPGSAADKAGIKVNDIILRVGDKDVSVDYPLAVALRRRKVGETVPFKILRDGQELTLEVKMEEKK
jgi:serine protease Do